MNNPVNRPGLKSTEFGSLMVFAVMMLLNGTEYVNIPSEQVMWFGGLVGVYGGGRTLLKNTIAKQPKE